MFTQSITLFITFMVLYSIIKPYNLFFLAVGEIPAKFKNLLSNHFLRPLKWRHTNTNRKWHRSFTNASRMQI